MGQHRADVVIIGAGTIGTAIAWRCAQRGLAVTIVDPGGRDGAWYTAAGMLAPITELHYAETPLFQLSGESLARFPSFVAELEQESGCDVALWRCGTLSTAWDAADLAALVELHAFGQTVGAVSTLLTGRELRTCEPALASGIPGGLLAADDHQVEPRELHAALYVAAGRAGAHHLIGRAEVLADDRARGVRLADGSTVAAETVVLAAGAWSGSIAGVPASVAAPVRPVKGQTLRLRLPGPPRLQHVLRASVHGNAVYVVPRADGRIVVGGSSEETGFDRTARAGAVYELLRDAQTVLPELGEAVLEEVCTGLRPGTPDNAPAIGPGALEGLTWATGHYRNGILLAPLTAELVAGLLAGDGGGDGAAQPLLAACDPQRFAGAGGGREPGGDHPSPVEVA
jgi:glycine oxidase